ncbi:chemotaxis protein CheW [Hydrogenophaga crassostreae]|nr:chemotaxis protein CheW [Hydrogenophaga crassostreae]
MTSHIEAWQIDGFLPHMRAVTRCDQSLRELNATWRMIESSAKINCAREARSILPMMSATRQGFEQLEGELVSSLVQERVDTVLQSIGIKAQHVADIIVRNLFERTADVGFLATDRVLCDYLAGDQGDRDSITDRLRAYRDKYTVYNDILMLDTEGHVRAQIDATSPLDHSSDALIAQTLASDGHVETCRASDLRPHQRSALIYSRRMHDGNGKVVGLLCLSFNFDDEMEGIFRARQTPEERSVMLLLDGQGKVMASSDGQWVPVGSAVPTNPDHSAQRFMFAGREYLIRTARSEGYQDYPGPPGWQGQVMVPVDVAFSGRRDEALDHLPADMAQGLLTHARQFCPPLFAIVTAAQAIRRVVWNGQVMTASQTGDQDLSKLKTILEQISEAGVRTDTLFTHSINDLYNTVLGSAMSQAEFVTHLQVDLLDRNLYERSDDCRWWAMSPELQRALAGVDAGEAQAVDPQATMTGVLKQIHALYTVYTRLVVYDAGGRIVAESLRGQSGQAGMMGQCIDPDCLSAVLGLPNAQSYHVSPFRSSDLYEGGSTYIYHAAIRHPEDERRVIGGIGIVFDAQPEFQAMLRDGLQTTDGSQTAMYALRDGRVIASIDPDCPTGSQLDLPETMRNLAPGASASRIVEHRGQYAVLACSASSGYREFKTSDGYREDVLAVTLEWLGAVNPLGQQRGKERHDDAVFSSDVENGQQFATFFLDGALQALPAHCVREALPAADIAPVAAGHSENRLGVIAVKEKDQATRYAWVYDLLGVLRGEATQSTADCQVLIARSEGVEIGLLVSGLHGVPEFLPGQIQNLQGEAPSGGFVKQIISAQGGKVLVPVLDVNAIHACLRGDLAAAAVAPANEGHIEGPSLDVGPLREPANDALGALAVNG